ncbi:MAG: FtsX-like permease family protein [bacterium]|nr:FtsX-like permease family protein [bacterium]
MLLNYIKIAFRNMIKNKGYTCINIIGLSIGMTCTLLLVMWVNHETGFDSFHKNRKNIYRVLSKNAINGSVSAATPGKMAAAVKEELPEVIDTVRILESNRTAVRYKDTTFYEETLFDIDFSLFRIFSFPFTRGNPDKAHKGIVITETSARKYFGDDDPIGKTLTINNRWESEVTGVIKDMPANSHLQLDFLSSLDSLEKMWKGGFNWKNFIHKTYVRLQDGADPHLTAGKIYNILVSNEPVLSKKVSEIILQPLSDIHLTAGINGEISLIVDKKYVISFSIIAFFILFIACINFMNLSTARSMNRGREVGIRKAIGAGRGRLIRQFLTESILWSLVSMATALVMVEICLPFFNGITGKILSVSYGNWETIAILSAMVMCTGLVAGSYPAFYLSSFKPAVILKNALNSGKKSALFRKTLVVIQFSISIFLLIGAALVSNQLHFLKCKSTGFDKENVIYLPIKDKVAKKYDSFKTRLLQEPGIMNVSAKSSLPLRTVSTFTIDWPERPEGLKPAMEMTTVDYSFLDTMNVKLAAGRNFSRDHASDVEEAVILNWKAVKMMELTSPIGKVITVAKEKVRIIGVIEDVHFKSLQYEINPIILRLSNDWSKTIDNLFGVILIKINDKNIPDTIQGIKEIWHNFNPTYPFDIHFLNANYEALYNNESRLSTLLKYFTILAIFVSCLGLFGLAAFMVERRTKEIGIRKVLGASVRELLFLLSKEYAKCVLLANLFAWPAAFLLMRRWLQNYAYRIDIGPRVFIFSAVAALLIALLAVGYQAFRAAIANPAGSLKYE